MNFGLFNSASRRSTAFGSGGLTRWWSNPASAVRRRSSCWPQPVKAASTTFSRPGSCRSPPSDFVAVHPRHSDVEEHHVGRYDVASSNADRAVVGDPNLVALQPQQHGEADGGVLVVINHQEPAA